MTKDRIKDRLAEMAEDCRRQAAISENMKSTRIAVGPGFAERMTGRAEVFVQLGRTLDGFRAAI
jgi:hypothetical protein